MDKSLMLFMNEHGKAIEKIIRSYHGNGFRLYFWGAGAIGTIFLQHFDPEHCYFVGAIDRNPEKQGKLMKSGHRVFSPEEAKADVIFVNGFTIEADVYKFYAARGEQRKIIELQDVFNGKSIEKIFADVEAPYQEVRKCKIGGVTVLYEPPRDFLKNICTYVDDLDGLLIYDNSSLSHQEAVKVAFGDRVQYVWNDGKNKGLPCAFNDAAKIMNKCLQGGDWLITFDQDSRAGSGMIRGMRAFANSQLCTEDIVLVSPWVVDYHVAGIHPGKIGMPRISYLIAPLQSGAMHRLSDLLRWSYDEQLFIDEVDFDYGVQCRLHGKKVIRLNHCELQHQVEDAYQTIAVDWRKYQKDKYPLVRWYYRYRNALYCARKYTGTMYQQYFADHVCSIDAQAQLEDNYEDIMRVFQRARADFEAGRMGKQDIRITDPNMCREVAK